MQVWHPKSFTPGHYKVIQRPPCPHSICELTLHWFYYLRGLFAATAVVRILWTKEKRFASHDPVSSFTPIALNGAAVYPDSLFNCKPDSCSWASQKWWEKKLKISDLFPQLESQPAELLGRTNLFAKGFHYFVSLGVGLRGKREKKGQFWFG